MCFPFSVCSATVAGIERFFPASCLCRGSGDGCVETVAELEALLRVGTVAETEVLLLMLVP